MVSRSLFTSGIVVLGTVKGLEVYKCVATPMKALRAAVSGGAFLPRLSSVRAL